ncbi:CPBP family intramembrane glutamic endopeptidase [Paludisphaera mucosa]|uniref:Type II CAAX endopeptidase family protein n=1 Tax=Paludisphaera mucosa TaxID=3030827 RepID=A0ABT6FFJ5_9BACT|nr:type II CAAX endopeptidase family protein [Paludisphaera mucosa]MDG3006266.1 type II CAAX endopeptidase family protein [Paludisphaera mucosa]
MSIDAVDSEQPLPPEAIVPTPVKPYPSIAQSWAIAGIVVLTTLVCSPLVLSAQLLGPEGAMLAYYAVAFGLATYIVDGIRRRKLGRSGYNFAIGSWRLGPPIVVGTVGLLFGVITPLQSLIPMPDAIGQGVKDLVGQTSAATFLYFVILAPIFEEMIFRGVMLDGLLRRYRPSTAILTSSLLFGIVHLNPWQFVTAFVLGCFFGWIYYRTGSLGCCVLGHMAANGSGYILRILLAQGVGGGLGDGNPLVHVGFTALAAVSIELLRREFRADRHRRVVPEDWTPDQGAAPAEIDPTPIPEDPAA